MTTRQDLERRLNHLRRTRTTEKGLEAESRARSHISNHDLEAAEREVLAAESESKKFASVKAKTL